MPNDIPSMCNLILETIEACIGVGADSDKNAIPLKQQHIQIVLVCRADTGFMRACPSREAFCLSKISAIKALPKNAAHPWTATRRYLLGQSWSAVWEGLCP